MRKNCFNCCSFRDTAYEIGLLRILNILVKDKLVSDEKLLECNLHTALFNDFVSRSLTVHCARFVFKVVTKSRKRLSA